MHLILIYQLNILWTTTWHGVWNNRQVPTREWVRNFMTAAFETSRCFCRDWFLIDCRMEINYQYQMLSPHHLIRHHPNRGLQRRGQKLYKTISVADNKNHNYQLKWYVAYNIPSAMNALWRWSPAERFAKSKSRGKFTLWAYQTDSSISRSEYLGISLI